jgi:hypothetical protein
MKNIGAISGFIKKIQELSCNFAIFWDFSELFFIGKIMNRVYGSRDHGWLLVHGGLVTMRRRDRSRAREVVKVSKRER